MKGRLIRNENLTSARGLAIDESLTDSVGRGEVPPTLHLYNYLPCLIVGRYQNAASCARLDRCEARHIDINRRATGGGTVFMTPDQLALALVVPNDFPGLPRTIQGAFEFLAAILSRALSGFGLVAEFMGKNDLTIGGRKIAGLAISQDHDASTFFHTSLLLDFDLETMLDVLNLPTQKMLDRGISCFGERMTTLKQETGRSIPISEILPVVHHALETQLNIPFPEESMTPPERERVQELLRERYENESWIYGVRAPRRRTAFSQRATPGGLIQVHLTITNGVLETILITGDYFSRTRDIAKLESLLRWTSADQGIISRRLQELQSENIIHRVDWPILTDLIVEAISRSDAIS